MELHCCITVVHTLCVVGLSCRLDVLCCVVMDPHPHAHQLAVETVVAVGAAGRDAHFGHRPERTDMSGDGKTELEGGDKEKEGGVAKRSPDVPLVLHQQLDVLDATVVGIVHPFRQVLLQVWPEVLLRLLALSGRRKNEINFLFKPRLPPHRLVCSP